MTLHPQLQAMVDASAGAPPMDSYEPEVLRTIYEDFSAQAPRPDVAHVEDRMIPGPRGDIRVRIYRPDMADDHPLITYFHGSAFVICSVDTHDVLCRHLCLGTNSVVVSVDYGLGPENKFPAGPDDSLAATRWVADNAVRLGGDPARLIVAGDSAGATMAIVTAMRVRDEGGPSIKAQLLIYPVTDYPDNAPPSYAERSAGCGMLTAEAMRWGWAHYLSEPADGAHPYASPHRATDLGKLPPAYVITAEYDILRDEGEIFAGQLKAAGADTTLIRYGDMNHGFMGMVGSLDRADEAMAAACDWLATKL
jgi:acetyl esterase